jgi:hypothetical protein
LRTGESDHVGQSEGLGDGGLVRNRPGRATAEVIDQQHIVAARDRFHVRQRSRFREAGHTVVGRVHAQKGCGAVRDSIFVIRSACAVGGPDLDHARARQTHHIGHAERPADLDQLAARHDHLPSFA